MITLRKKQHRYLGLGMGGMERVTALPLHAFLLVAGSLLLIRGRRKHHEVRMRPRARRG